MKIVLPVIGLVFSVLIIAWWNFQIRPNYKVNVLNPTPVFIQQGIQHRQVPSYDHIIIIVLENKSDTQIADNSSAPFLNSFIKQNAYAANYSAVSHPSLPNYLTLIGGDTFGVTSDCETCYLQNKNLVDELDVAHKTWKAYMESMPKSCFLGSAAPYAQKHDPFIYFDDIRTNPSRCANIVPFDTLSGDLSNPLTAPNFIWITPNLCDDMHDCSVAAGDNWLSQHVPQIMNAPAFKLQNLLLVLTFDEGESGSNNVVTIFAGSHIKQGFVSQIAYSHYSLLHTIESSWDLPGLTPNDQQSPIMADFFIQ